MARLFFALWPDDAVRIALAQLSRAAQALADGRVTQARNLHMTLVFLGDTDASRIPQLQSAARSVHLEPCVMSLDRCAYWKHNRIVWAGGHAPDPLQDAVGQLRSALADAAVGFDAKPFAPHVTLLRNARAVPVLPQPEPIIWHIRDFVLVASGKDAAGPLYRIMGDRFGDG